MDGDQTNRTVMPIRQLLDSSTLTEIDAVAVGRYNSRVVNEDYLLHPELGPSAFEGDIDNAPAVLLLSNPGYDGTSTPEDHTFARPGWPLGGLHPEAPEGLRNWWTRRLGALIGRFGAQRVSQRVACLQLTPWASGRFDSGLRLPSRQRLLEAADRVAQSGALLLVMRSERLWFEAAGVSAHPRRFHTNNPRCAYVSEGNLPPDAWRQVLGALEN